MTEIKPLGEFRQKHRKCFLKIWQRIHFWYCLLEIIFFTSAWWLAGHPCRGFNGHQKKCLHPGYLVQIFPTALLHIIFVEFYRSFSKQRCANKRVLMPGTCCTLGCFQLMKAGDVSKVYWDWWQVGGVGVVIWVRLGYQKKEKRRQGKEPLQTRLADRAAVDWVQLPREAGGAQKPGDIPEDSSPVSTEL